MFEAECAIVREAQPIRGVRPGSGLRQQLDLLGRYPRTLQVSGLRRVLVRVAFPNAALTVSRRGRDHRR